MSGVIIKCPHCNIGRIVRRGDYTMSSKNHARLFSKNDVVISNNGKNAYYFGICSRCGAIVKLVYEPEE